ncbi:PREDICTED: leucine-rich repeat-containing protein 15-like [Trachymyrmex cornetzi]|uniref:Leucine-rich repeat-containing protein 15 n=1 Tax=Trachymyrmex cornetzi TaxID=471704 RepID=A0A195DYV6_9HYME|nr:PREDICTED: leucine-rich repeat-containing protein 15-like [Trachymyrmex cornetzi]KYN18016.1 Leucine-rich repeat-containing protein 15 [Trachymyrmex cornetzi]
MKSIISLVKSVFIIITFVCWSTSSRANVYFAIENYMNESLQSLCNDDVSLNFSNAVISEINQNFISSPVITCLNLMNNSIGKIGKGAFEKLPNLTQLFLSNNELRPDSELLDFGGHDKLQVLIVNNARTRWSYQQYIQIFDEYPNLEILSLRENYAVDLKFVQKTPFREDYFNYMTPMTLQSWMPFPKLKILDLSENSISETNFVQLLSNSLYFLDLHDNLLSRLDLNEKGNKLFALNLDKNEFNIIQRYNNQYGRTLSLASLKNLHYLSVSRNKINTVESDAFRNNNELLFLNLSSNQIHYLHPETFANLQYLKTLDLSINQLENAPQISINETEISILYINNNNIKKIISHSFVHMPKLMKLLIGKNQIDKIDVNAFAHLTVLEELDLSRNMLSSLPEGWTESLVSLKYLNLSDNKFTSLESLSLTNTLPLIEVYLMKNSLEYLNVKYFENLPQNLTIDLINSNFIKYIRERTSSTPIEDGIEI